MGLYRAVCGCMGQCGLWGTVRGCRWLHGAVWAVGDGMGL